MLVLEKRGTTDGILSITTHNDESSSVEASTKEQNSGRNMVSLESTPSTETTETVPFDFDSDSENESDPYNEDSNEEEEAEEEEDTTTDTDDNNTGVCPICCATP